MARPELGTKCACKTCAERFYDLNRSPAICPKCGANQPPILVRAARPMRSPSGSAHISRRPVAVIVEEDAEPLAAVEDDEDEDAAGDGDVPEIDAEVDGDIDPVTVRD